MKKNKSIFITGGAGYVGSALVPKLLSLGYNVTVLDLFIFGKDTLENHSNLKLIEGDIRNIDLISQTSKNHDVFIHLACISNDPSFELNPKLGKSINLDCFEPMVQAAIKNKIKLFIYASSSSVYGLKNEKDVTENVSLEPLTDYSKFKADCEKILLKYKSKDFHTTVVRPATVCGYAKRQRLDVVVNILTNYAFNKKKIKVFGGEQLRPNIHIKDMVSSYLKIIESPIDKVSGQIFNVGYQNLQVQEIAKLVKKVIDNNIELDFEKTDDNRSYHISSGKINKLLGFEPEFTVENAIQDLKEAFEKKLLPNSFTDEKYFNIKKFEKIDLK